MNQRMIVLTSLGLGAGIMYWGALRIGCMNFGQAERCIWRDALKQSASPVS
jgi:hypothetical protein